MLFGKYLECYARGATSSAIHSLASKKASVARLVCGVDELKSDERLSQSDREIPISLLGRGRLDSKCRLIIFSKTLDSNS